jgi:hypothetical protein
MGPLIWPNAPARSCVRSSPASELDRIGGGAWVAADVDAVEAEAGEAVECPGGGQPGERVLDVGVTQPMVEYACQLDATSRDMSGDDVMAIEAVLVGPRIQQQVTVAGA